MTKKHFIALADALRGTRPDMEDNHAPHLLARQQWRDDVRAVADFCQAQSPRFKRERWMDYVNGKCGPNGGAK